MNKKLKGIVIILLPVMFILGIFVVINGAMPVMIDDEATPSGMTHTALF